MCVCMCVYVPLSAGSKNGADLGFDTSLGEKDNKKRGLSARLLRPADFASWPAAVEIPGARPGWLGGTWQPVSAVGRGADRHVTLLCSSQHELD